MNDRPTIPRESILAGATLQADGRTSAFRKDGLYVVHKDFAGRLYLRNDHGAKVLLVAMRHGPDLVGFTNYETRSAH